ncbi:MAG: hypothetical protein IH840_15080 [Candidatus Heimdallarchaeota archaeon]|nr:hypothetical protein [Candidatus Heimdallarchaeota archaeon]
MSLSIFVKNFCLAKLTESIDRYTRANFEDYENPQKRITFDVLEGENAKLDNETAMDDNS